MLSLVAGRALSKIEEIQNILSGETELPPMPGAENEDNHRNRVALALIGRLGMMLKSVLTISSENDAMLFGLAGGSEMVQESEPEEEEKPAFGFAAWRNAA